MPKQAVAIRFRLPPYRRPRNSWRKAIHALALDAAGKRRIAYRDSDRLEVTVRLYMPQSALAFQDVDNRLKDVLDALQGRLGGSKASRSVPPLIPNDNQVYRVTVEKGAPPKQSKGLGHVSVRTFKPRNQGAG